MSKGAPVMRREQTRNESKTQQGSASRADRSPDDNGNPIQPVLSQAAEAAVTNLLPLLEQHPELVQAGLAHLNKYNHYPPAHFQSSRTSLTDRSPSRS